MPIALGIHGAGGRMGRAVEERLRAHPEFALAARIGRSGGWTPGLQVVIDFSVAGATAACARRCASEAIALVVGTTGLGPEDEQAIREAARRVAVVWSSNMSVGVAAVARVLPSLRAALARFDVAIVEAHHRGKRDAPSGTAAMLAKALGGSVPIASVRAGEIVGEHRVIFAGPGEAIEILHRADSRAVFAEGALGAARFASSAPPGLYGMAEVLDARA